MDQNEPLKMLEELAQESAKYPVEAFHFIREGLQYAVTRLHGQKGQQPKHISGQELCWGLRDYALKLWGLMAPEVLRRWGITRTDDFGAMVFAMVEAGWMAKSDHDTVRDFDGVFEFRAAFDAQIDLGKFQEAS